MRYRICHVASCLTPFQRLAPKTGEVWILRQQITHKRSLNQHPGLYSMNPLMAQTAVVGKSDAIWYIIECMGGNNKKGQQSPIAVR